MRINQFLAAAGLGSRRACEQLVLEGRVQINGIRVEALGTQIASTDHVQVDGQAVQSKSSRTIMLHKPPGCVCTATPQSRDMTIYELLPKDWPRLFSIGRLDKESEGLILLTNDGALSQALAHPRAKIRKTYVVTLDRKFDPVDAPRLKKGMTVEGKAARFDEVESISPRAIKVVLTQGLKRQIRVMLEELGYGVRRLVRTQIGGLRLGDLPPGRWKVLADTEVKTLFEQDAQSKKSKVRKA